MNYRIFDVVELYTKEKATIIDINKETYKVQITDNDGRNKYVKDIKSKDIKNVIYQK